MARGKTAPDDDDLATSEGVDRQLVLDCLGVITETQLAAAIYGCGQRAMKNRPRSELPPYFRAGGKRLFFREDVVKFFRNRTGD